MSEKHCAEHSDLQRAAIRIEAMTDSFNLVRDDVKYLRERIDKLTWVVAGFSSISSVIVTLTILFISKSVK